MKKKVIFLVLTLVFCIGCFNFGKLFNSDVLEDKVNELDSVKHLSSLNTLSMMLETEAGSGEYTMETRSSWPTKDDGYVFNETLSKCENGSALSWNEENNIVVMSGSISDKCYVYFDIYVAPSRLSSCNDSTLACYVAKQYNEIQGNNNIYYFNSSLKNGIGDLSYRYSGSSADVCNYVCFGSDASTCPDDNLYRIIGVFDDQARLIKADYATSAMLGTDTSDYVGVYSYLTSSYQGDNSNLTNIAEYYWNDVNHNTSKTEKGYANDWSYSELNKTHLNKNYINYLDNINTKWANMIDITEWKIGGFKSRNVIASMIYTNEIVTPLTDVTSTYNSKIGLMYVSDYAYAALPNAWTVALDYYGDNDASGNKISEGNWMYMGLYEWTITRSDYSSEAYNIHYLGSVNDSNISYDARAVRPVFHLVSSVKYVSGTGAKSDPIRIKVD